MPNGIPRSRRSWPSSSERVAENPLPKDRKRTEFHKHPLYYGVRNHIIDFLIARSRNFTASTENYDPRHVPVIKPGFVEPAIAASKAPDKPPRAASA